MTVRRFAAIRSLARQPREQSPRITENRAYMAIVTSTYRYKRPPKKRKPAVPLEGPTIITIRDRKRVTVETPEKIQAETAEQAQSPAESMQATEVHNPP